MLVYLLFIERDEDKSLFEEIFYKFRKQMIYYAFGFVSNEIDAEDIVHDVFLKIAQKNLVVLKKIKSEIIIRNIVITIVPIGRISIILQDVFRTVCKIYDG